MAVLGSGSTGVVTSAHDSVTGTLVAVKWIARSLQATPGFPDRFRHDVSALSDLESPYLAQVYEYVDGARDAAVVTEFVDGVTLRRVLDKTGPLEPETALYLTKSVLLGLGAAHNRGVVHRDLKPENIIVNSVGQPKVTDFDITSVSTRDFLPGDHRYRAPELTGGIEASRASDIYAAGVMLLELLTGKRPDLDGRGPDAEAVLNAADVPERIRKMVLRSVARQPANRFARADSMLDDLEMAALDAYGRSWADDGKASLMRRITPLLINRGRGPNAVTRSVAATARWANGVGRVRLAVAGGLVFLLGVAAVTLTSNVFPSPDAGAGLAPAATHTPMVLAGPSLPTPSAGSNDKEPPAQPTGVRVIGRSETAVTLDWNASVDNVKVAGYLIERSGARVGTSFLPGFTIQGLSPQTTYPLTVIAFDDQGNLSTASAVVLATTLNRPDKTPPSVPTGLRMTSHSQSMITLAWSPSRDNVGVAGYDVFRDGARVGEVARPNFTDSKLTANSAHTYVVVAFDTSNNASANSARLTARTLAAPDRTPPSTPSITTLSSAVTSITVSWSASSDANGVARYLLYRGSSKIAEVAAPTTAYTDSGLKPETTYAYSVAAVDASGNVSKRSAAKSATTLSNPTPPSSPTPTPPGDPTPTPPPGDPTPTPPPAPVIHVSVHLESVTAACNIPVDVTITVQNGPVSGTMRYTVGGQSGQAAETVDGSKSITLDLTGDASHAGAASVVFSGSGFNDVVDSAAWDAAPQCIPTPTDPPTDASDGGVSTNVQPSA